jgi:hypothetical protein
MKAYWGSGDIAPRILDLGTRWRWAVSFTSLPLYPQGKSPWYPLDRRLGGPQSRSGRGGEKKNSQSLPGLEPPIIQPVVQSYTTMLSPPPPPPSSGGVATTFPEWFYCKHTCMLTAYWEGSPYKYSPWTAVHLAQRCSHCWKCFWNSCCGIAFSAVITFFGCLQYPEIFVPLRETILGNSRKHSEPNQGNR